MYLLIIAISVSESLNHDTIAEKNEKIIVDVETNNRFETLVDINDHNGNQAQHHPVPRLECESSDQKYTSSWFTSTPTSSSSAFITSAVTTSSSTSVQERIQCDQCSRKCVDNRDMEHHIYLWHTDTKKENLDGQKET